MFREKELEKIYNGMEVITRLFCSAFSFSPILILPNCKPVKMWLTQAG